MVTAFGSRLNHSLASLSVPSSILQEIQTQKVKLAGLQMPVGIDSGMTSAIKRSIADAFVFGFRIVMLLCAGLSVASAAVAKRMLSKAA
jgi:hypothetical protein